MKAEKFYKKLAKLLEDSGEFVIDEIDMKDTRVLAKQGGFDDVMLVCGEGEDEVFSLLILKIKP